MSKDEDPPWSLSRVYLMEQLEADRRFRASEFYGDFVRSWVEFITRQIMTPKERWHLAWSLVRRERRDGVIPDLRNRAGLVLDSDVELARTVRDDESAPGR